MKEVHKMCESLSRKVCGKELTLDEEISDKTLVVRIFYRIDKLP